MTGAASRTQTTTRVWLTADPHHFTADEIDRMEWKAAARGLPITAEAVNAAICESDGDLMVPFLRRITATLHVVTPNPAYTGDDVLPGIDPPAPTIHTTCEVVL